MAIVTNSGDSMTSTERGPNLRMEADAREVQRGVGDAGPFYIRSKASIGEVQELRERVAELNALLNEPITNDFIEGVRVEAPHQRNRWGVDHDAGKTPWDWFWLIGYLAQKAATAAVAGDVEKAKHHTISTAAALANWHLALSGGDDRMRPGIVPPADGVAVAREMGE